MTRVTGLILQLDTEVKLKTEEKNFLYSGKEKIHKLFKTKLKCTFLITDALSQQAEKDKSLKHSTSRMTYWKCRFESAS